MSGESFRKEPLLVEETGGFELRQLSKDQFYTFFKDIYGFEPYSWQLRLASHVLEMGRFPDEINLPTGSGKTALVDIAIFALAARPDLFPRRIVFVIDRRIVVDQVYERVRLLTSAIESPRTEVLAVVKARLDQLSDAPMPIGHVSLRGGIHIDGEWAKRVDQPWVIVSTVDHFGSRLLFRGYGISRGMRPIHAGLTGNDCLVVLDEVHLSVPFRDTLKNVQALQNQKGDLLPRRFQVVEMSATFRDTVAANTFELTDEDLAQSPKLQKVVNSPKHVNLVEINDRASFAKTVARRVAELQTSLQNHAEHSLDSCFTVGVIVNRVQTARETLQAIKGLDIEASLITGRMRPLDKADAVANLLPYVTTSMKKNETGFRVVVATQAIEVGADFDFDHLITECSPIDCIRQRLGRLDRQGEQFETNDSPSVASIFGIKSELKSRFDDPVYGKATKATWTYLSDSVGQEHENLYAKVQNETAPVDCFSPHLDAPLLLPTYTDAWVQTNPEPGVQPDVDWFLHGIDVENRVVPEISIVWRWDISTEAIKAVVPRQVEMLELPMDTAKRWLDAEGKEAESIQDEADDVPHRSRVESEPNRSTNKLKCWDRSLGQVIEKDFSTILPGEVVFVNPEKGGLSDGVWDPDSQDMVEDLGDIAQHSYGERITLRLDPRIVHTQIQLPQPQEELDSERPIKQRIEEWLQSRRAELSEDSTEHEIISTFLEPRRLHIQTIVHQARSGQSPEEDYFVLLEQNTTKGTLKVDESMMEDAEETESLTGSGVTLKSHLAGVGKRAEYAASRLGFSEKLIQDLKLAGELHDIGKVDNRFQRMLLGGDDIRFETLEEPLAKSISSWRRTNIYPTGMRHETASLALICSNLKVLNQAHDPDLVLHLVGSHHGWCRPFPQIVLDENPLALRYAVSGVTLIASSDQIDSNLAMECADRFWRLVDKYGYYGLAWLESVIRLSDHVQSASEGNRA